MTGLLFKNARLVRRALGGATRRIPFFSAFFTLPPMVARGKIIALGTSRFLVRRDWDRFLSGLFAHAALQPYRRSFPSTAWADGQATAEHSS